MTATVVLFPCPLLLLTAAASSSCNTSIKGSSVSSGTGNVWFSMFFLFSCTTVLDKTLTRFPLVVAEAEAALVAGTVWWFWPPRPPTRAGRVAPSVSNWKKMPMKRGGQVASLSRFCGFVRMNFSFVCVPISL